MLLMLVVSCSPPTVSTETQGLVLPPDITYRAGGAKNAVDVDLATLRPSDTCGAWVSGLSAGGVHVVPASGCLIKSAIILSKPTSIVGNGATLYFTDSGRMDIEADNCSISDSFLVWDRAALLHSSYSMLIRVNADGMAIKGNTFLTSFDDSARSMSEIPTGKGPWAWLVRNRGGGRASLSNIEVSGNRMTNVYWYSVGVMYVSVPANLVVVSDNIVRFHNAGFYATDCTDCEFSWNRMLRVSSTNFYLSGKRLAVKNNRILYHGNSTAGDGVALSNASDAVISYNEIRGGGCYATPLYGTTNNVRISNNTFAAGITTAIYIPSTSAANNIEIFNNIFSASRALGVLAYNVNGLSIIENVFHDQLGRESTLVNCTDVKYKNNLSSEPYDAAGTRAPWGSNMTLYK